jgi:hypothetical protein
MQTGLADLVETAWGSATTRKDCHGDDFVFWASKIG